MGKELTQGCRHPTGTGQPDPAFMAHRGLIQSYVMMEFPQLFPLVGCSRAGCQEASNGYLVDRSSFLSFIS